jgi:hypothetical protein
VGGRTLVNQSAAVRWLRQSLEEDESLTIEEAAVAASCLSALGGPSHEEALGVLSAMAERVSQGGRGRTVVA